MTFFDRLERRCGWLAFPGFLRIYALFHVLVFAIRFIRPDIGELLDFNRERIFAGEVWRLGTMFFASVGRPSPASILFLICAVNFIFMVGDGLEGAWGVFKASLFYYAGIALILLLNFLYPVTVPLSGMFLYASAFFAFATLFPRAEILLLFVLPAQMRFIAFVLGAGLLAMAVSEPVLLPYFLIVFLNYILWAGIPALRGTARLLGSGQRRKRFNAAGSPAREAFHTCAVCQKTDITDPHAEFRIGHDGEEYCSRHLPDVR